MWEDFKKFAMRGNVIDLAVGVVVGAAFGNIVKSVVDHLIMPPIGLLTGGIDFSKHYIKLKGPTVPGTYATPEELEKAGAVLIRYGLVINSLVSFLIVAFAVFLLVRGVERLHRHKPAPPTTKDCPECAMAIPVQALRCGHCTSELRAGRA
jgi:large conductance mechanosensitive channel